MNIINSVYWLKEGEMKGHQTSICSSSGQPLYTHTHTHTHTQTQTHPLTQTHRHCIYMYNHGKYNEC